MSNDVDELRDKALANKKKLKSKSLSIPIGDYEYDFKIRGIGPIAIKLVNYIKYEDIFQAIEENREGGLETIIKAIIEENRENTSTAEELKNMARENKEEIKSKVLTLEINNMRYDFNIDGIGNKLIMIERFMKYEDIIGAVYYKKENSLEELLKTQIEKSDDIDFETNNITSSNKIENAYELSKKNKKSETMSCDKVIRKLKNENKALKKELEKTPKDYEAEINRLVNDNKYLKIENERLKRENKSRRSLHYRF